MITLLLLSLLGAVLAAVIGTIWYSNKTPMGKIHMEYLGFNKLTEEEQKKLMEEAKPKMLKMYGLQTALSLLTAFFVVVVTSFARGTGMPITAVLIVLTIVWLCFTVPTIGTALLWSNCDRKIVWKKFFSDTLSNLVTILITAMVVNLFV